MKRALLAALVLTVACAREERRFAELPPLSGMSDGRIQSPIRPGHPLDAPTFASGGASSALASVYEENAWAIGEGKRLYTWFNCNGCHANGGGGMGPPLMDEKWFYGSSPEDIYTSIVEGRPQGMPAFRGKIPDPLVWRLVAYVRSMSGLVRLDVRPGRSDHLSAKEPESMVDPVKPITVPHP